MRIILMLLLGLVWLVWPGRPVRAQAPAGAPQVLIDFRFPEYDDAGQLKTEVYGDKATMNPDGSIDVTNLQIVFYENGKPAMRVSAPPCTYNKEAQTASSDSRVLVERKEILLTGVGFRCRLKDKQMKINNKAKVVLSRLKEQIMQETKQP